MHNNEAKTKGGGDFGSLLKCPPHALVDFFAKYLQDGVPYDFKTFLAHKAFIWRLFGEFFFFSCHAHLALQHAFLPKCTYFGRFFGVFEAFQPAIWL